MLFKLSLKNIKKSFKDYTIYFFTLILGISIFYIFNSIESQTVMMNVSKSTRNIIELMNNMLSAVSVFVSFILGFLIIYAGLFLIKRRSKEFGVYLTLGMSKRKVSKILLLETIFIGIISLIVGLLLGTVLSQLMSLLVANMFEADLTNFKFIFSTSSAIKTCIYFGIIYLIVMIFNVVVISKCKLIDLIRNNKKNEKQKLKNPIISSIILILSCIDLAVAYYMVTSGLEILDDVSLIFIPIIMGIVGTFFLFWSLSGLLIRIFKSMKKTYYKGLNSFTLKQISSRINTTVVSMTIISLMLFVTICVLSSALSLKNSMTYNLKKLVPMDIQFYKKLDITGSNDDTTIDDSHLTIKETLTNFDFNTSDYLTDIFDFNIYKVEDIKVKDTLGDFYEEAKKLYPKLIYDTPETFMKLSDYNKLAEFFNLEKINLKSDEYALIADFEEWGGIRNKSLELETEINILGKTYKPKYNKYIDGFLYMSPNHINTGYFVVPDESLNENLRDENILIANYKGETKEDREKIEEIINTFADKSYANNTNLKANSKITSYESSVGLGAMATFIGLYLGIIFLISSAAILALKELSESSDNIERYKVLRRLGADEEQINKALFKQIGLFFIFPLIIAIIHSIFGIIFCNFILETIGNEKLLLSILMTAIFLIIIYGCYFLITYFCSKNIIKEQ